MGYHEYFLYSKNNKGSVEELTSTLLKRSNTIVDILCGAETKTEIASDNVRIFGVETDITPVHLSASTNGVVIVSDLADVTSCFTAFDKMRFQPEAVCLDDVMLSTNAQNVGKVYEDYFADKPIVVNGKTYMSEQNKSEGKKMSISDDELKERLDDHKLWLETRETYMVQGKKLDLYEANIPGADLSGLDLTDAVFAYTDLRHVNFTNTILKNAVMGYTDLTGANLTGVDATNAKFPGADFTGADLTNTNLTSADCNHATFNGVDLTTATLTDADVTDVVGMNAVNAVNGVPIAILSDGDIGEPLHLVATTFDKDFADVIESLSEETGQQL